MSVHADLPPPRIAAALAAYARNLDDAVRWADPSWTLPLQGGGASRARDWRDALDRAAAPVRAVCSRAFVHRVGLRQPAFGALAAPAVLGAAGACPNLALLDALQVERGVSILRMRALVFRRAEIRRLVDRHTRAQLAQWTGVRPDAIANDQHMADAPDIAWLTMHAGLAPLAMLDAAAMAAEGWLLAARDAGIDVTAGMVSAQPPALLRLALPCTLAPSASMPAASGLDPAGTVRLFAQLPELLPEVRWLFG